MMFQIQEYEIYYQIRHFQHNSWMIHLSSKYQAAGCLWFIGSALQLEMVTFSWYSRWSLSNKALLSSSTSQFFVLSISGDLSSVFSWDLFDQPFASGSCSGVLAHFRTWEVQFVECRSSQGSAFDLSVVIATEATKRPHILLQDHMFVTDNKQRATCSTRSS